MKETKKQVKTRQGDYKYTYSEAIAELNSTITSLIDVIQHCISDYAFSTEKSMKDLDNAINLLDVLLDFWIVQSEKAQKVADLVECWKDKKD